MIGLLLVPLFPVAAALIALVFGRRLPERGGWVATCSMLLSVLGLGLLAGPVLRDEPVRITTEWMTVGRLELTMGLWLDGLAWWTALVVAVICLLVTAYAIGYMRDEGGRPRFFALMAFFCGSMLALVLADSLVLLFMAWEGVGLASFGLIGFWYRQDEARRAAQKAFLMTRLGDLGLLLGWLLILVLQHTTSIEAFTTSVARGALPDEALTLIALLFFAAAVGKSAQLPLTAWLPDAMVGPTPVSALLHSATMVAAGVYLILRLFSLFEAAPHALTVVLWTGAATALLAALIATAQYDLKRILAWSTVSQLGEMMMALGLGGPTAAAFHLTTHAAFKSTLFLTAGAVDRAAGSRDLRELGGLDRAMPLTAGIFGVCALALAGFPPFAGFWSEDMILGAAQAQHPGWAVLLLVLIFLAGVYISRAGWAVFGRWTEMPVPKGERPPALMLGPMLLLGIVTIFLGFAIKAPIEHVLPFLPAHHTLGLWRWAAIGASALGLGFGTWRVRQAGPVPALGGFLQALGTAVHVLARAPAWITLRLAAFMPPLERGLDELATAAGHGALAVGHGIDAAEQGFDAAARAMGRATLQSAYAIEAAEQRGFGHGLDQFAYGFRRAGRRLRALQTGKVFQYTFSLFIWVLIATVVALILWL